MKKLLLSLLFIPALLSAQNVMLKHEFINTPTAVGDTITMAVMTSSYNDLPQTLLQFDYRYNNKLIEKLDHEFITDSQSSLNHWDGYNYFPGQNEIDLSAQYVWWTGGNSSYQGSADWSVERITLQGSSNIPHDSHFLKVRFIVKDIANTEYVDYLDIAKLSWARSVDNATGVSNQVYAMNGGIGFDLSSSVGSDVVLKLQTQAENLDDYVYSILDNGELIASGPFDANGEAIVSGLDLELNLEILASANNSAIWLDDVVSITDAYLSFLAAIDAGSIPDFSGNKESTEIIDYVFDVNVDGYINFDDSYALLSKVIGEHVTGTYITKDTQAYNITDVQEVDVPEGTNTTFELYHYFMGDTDFSHSYYPEQNNTVATARFSLAKEAIEQHDLDLTTQLVDGKVEFAVNLDRSDLSALEFIVNYDDTKLEFDKIIFDTGDNITNYSTLKQNAVYFGSIDPSAQLQVKTGQSYKILFTPKVQVTNAAGLIYFKRQEAVTTNGQKINLNLK